MKQKVIIIGAGVIGCNLAEEFTRRGAAVTVIDAAETATGTSAATFAWVNANNKSPAEYGHLNFLGLRAHERAAKANPVETSGWFHQCGHVQVAQSDEELATLEAKVERLASNGYEADLLTRADVLELEPSINPSRLLGGAFYAQEGWVDVQKMCLTLLNQAVQAGAEYASFETVAEIQPKRVTTTTPDGSIRHHDGDVIVVAAGNGNRKILATIGVDFPIVDPTANGTEGGTREPNVGIISTTGPIDSGISHIIHAQGIAVRPSRNGGITFADHPTGGKWDLGDPRIWTIPSLLLERARELFPALNNTSVESVNLGIRVLPVDGVTIADWVNDDHSIYAVATHSGVTLAAHLAEAVSNEVLTGTRHSSLEAFGLSRFVKA